MKICLVTIGRLENRYTIEFIEHYKQLGFDHIYICDNNYDGEEYFEEVLGTYINDGFVTLFNYRNQFNIQIWSMVNSYYILKDQYDWIFFCDFDEFLILKNDKTIKEYINRDCFKDTNQILINWQMYTDNDLIYDDGRSCLERFTIPNLTIFDNIKVKSIIKTGIENVHLDCPHVFYNEILNETTYNSIGEKIKPNAFISPIHYDLAYIKHFSTKTVEEWVKYKCRRGVIDRNLDKFFEDYKGYFFNINKVTPEKLNYLKEHNINIDNLNL